MIKRDRAFLLLVVLFTLLFIGLLVAGAHLRVTAGGRLSALCFLLAFFSVGGQMVSLALYLRHRAASQPIPASSAHPQKDIPDDR